MNFLKFKTWKLRLFSAFRTQENFETLAQPPTIFHEILAFSGLLEFSKFFN